MKEVFFRYLSPSAWDPHEAAFSLVAAGGRGSRWRAASILAMRPVHPALLFALFTPSTAMRIGPAAATRRAFLGISAAALAPGSAGAETEPEDVILRRALDNNLSVQRVIQRAKEDALISGDKASCEELERIIEVDQEAVAFEMGKLEGLAILQTNEIGDDSSVLFVLFLIIFYATTRQY